MSNEIMLVLLAFVAGVLAHWLLRWLLKSEPDNVAHEGDMDLTATASDFRLQPGIVPAGTDISKLVSEIENVKSALEELKEDDLAKSEELSTLEDALKRANGRLKVISKAISKNVS